MATGSPDDEPLRIGISACLLGREVRHDGGHKRDPLLSEGLGPFVEWVPVCPELELGMGVPRESVRLERGTDGLRMVAPGSGTDWTLRMSRFAARRVRALAALGLDGYVLKKDSPSCGLERVKVHARSEAASDGSVTRDGRGLFAAALVEALPMLPVEEEDRLHEPRVLEDFLERARAWRHQRRTT